MALNQLNPTAGAVASQVGGGGTGNDQQVADAITALDADSCRTRWTRGTAQVRIGTVNNSQEWYDFGLGETDVGTVIESISLCPDLVTNDTAGDTITASLHLVSFAGGSAASSVRLSPEREFSARSSIVPIFVNYTAPFVLQCNNAFVPPGETWGLKLVASSGTAEWTDVSIVVAYRHPHVG